MTVKKYGLGLMNPVTSVKENYLRSQRSSAELIQDVLRGGAFYHVNYLLKLREEMSDGQKNMDGVNDATLKGLFRDLKGTNRRLILRSKNTGAWLNVRGTTVTGTVFLAT